MSDYTSSNSTDILSLTAEIVASYVGNAAHVQASEIPNIIRSIRTALSESDAPVETATEAATPKATPSQIRKSITPDALISFVDNKPYKTLKRHLTTRGMSHSEYKARYGLPQDYPSVAPNYSAARSEMAKRLGLGARGRVEAQTAARPVKAAAKGARKSKTAAPAPAPAGES